MKLYTAEVTNYKGEPHLINAGGTHSTKGSFFLTEKGAREAGRIWGGSRPVRILVTELDWQPVPE